MVSRRELLKSIERNRRTVQGQRQQLGESLESLRGEISSLEPVQKEKLPQRRFGAPVAQVKERQQQTLRRRQQASTGILQRQTEIERLGQV